MGKPLHFIGRVFLHLWKTITHIGNYLCGLRNSKKKRWKARFPRSRDYKGILKQREGELEDGKQPRAIYKRVPFEELKEEFLDDYRINQKKSLERAEISARHLDDFFSGWRWTQITTASIKRYIQRRLDDGASNGTVNRELRALGRMLSLGYQDGKVARILHLPMLKESDPRQGFFEQEEYIALLKVLPSFLRPAVTFAYRTGWRKSEIMGLTWDKINLKERTANLLPSDTKNKEARSIYLDDELLRLLQGQKLRRVKECPYVFHRKGKLSGISGGHGKKLAKKRDYRVNYFMTFEELL